MFIRLNQHAFSRRFIIGLSSMLLFGCSSVPMGASVALAQNEGDTAQRSDAESQGMDSQLMFEIMIAELAGRRGQLDVALAGYLQASEKTTDPRVSERAVRLAMFGRQWAEAEAAARRWVELDSQAPDAGALLALALLQQDKNEEAARQFMIIVNSADDKARALRQVVAELESLNQPEQTIGVMRAVTDAFPEQLQAQLGHARIALQAAQYEAALNSVDRALALSATEAEAQLLKGQILIADGQTDEALVHLQSSLAGAPENIQLRLGYAQLLVEAGRFDDVTQHLDVLADSASENPDVLLRISLLALDSRRLERARTYLGQLQGTGQYPDQANFYLARISDQQKDYDQAIVLYDEVQSGELGITAQIRSAELLGITGELEKGRQKLRQLAAAAPNPALQPRFLTAESRMLQSAGETSEAVSVLTDGLTRFPGDADLLYARALAAEKNDDDDMMIADLNTLIEADPNNAHALNALGYHYADSNIELEEAEVLLVKANALLPNDPAIMDSLGWLRYRQGRLDEAVTILKAAYQLYPDAEIAAHLGEALWLSGEEAEARQLLEEALLSAPADDKLLQVMQKYIE